MATYSEFRDYVLAALQAAANTTYPDSLVYQATCGAINAILPWVPKTALVDLPCDGVVTSFAVPADIYRIEAIQDLTRREFLERIMLAPGSGRKPMQSHVDMPQWAEYPRGFIHFSLPPASQTILRLFYFAYYAKPASLADLTFQLETPTSAYMGMVYWAAAHCLIPAAAGASQIRQFNLKIDSGVPTDNAVEQQAKFMRSLFADEMSRQPRYSGASQ